MSDIIGSRRTRKFLKKVLREREENLVRLNFDRHFTDKTYPKEKEEELENLEREIERVQGEVDKERMKPNKLINKEGLIEFEDKLNGKAGQVGLKQKRDDLKSRLDMAKKQIEKINFNIGIEERMIKTIKGYIKNPKQIYET